MEQRYLTDTNTVIEYLNNNLPDNIASLIDEKGACRSVITRIELLAWPKAAAEDIELLKAFINESEVFALNESILKTIDIRKIYRVKLPDAIIAATAIIHNCTLKTRNRIDFKNIAALAISNPY